MARPTKHEFRYKHVGRSSKLTPEIILKLEQCASIRATPKEICFYANINESTYYRWLQENPDLKERLEDLRQKAFVIARTTIVNGLDKVDTAFKFLEKEKPEEYGDKLKIEHSGSVGNDDISHPEDEELRKEYKQKLVENLQKRWKNKNEHKESS